MSEFKFPVSLTTGARKSLTAFNANSATPLYMADEFHPNWDRILVGLRNGDDSVWELFSLVDGMMNRFNQITERVSFNGSEVLWDGDAINSVFSKQLERAILEGNPDNYTALARFWEKVESNPSDHSKGQLYDWLASHEFQITLDGDVVAYKGVTPTEKEGVYLSGWASAVPGKPSGYVNGTPVPELSTIPQSVGDVVTMPRSEVVHNPNKACERGLHVATRSYASSFGTLLEVHANPRDFVSVPRDGRGAKARVCRYVVASLAREESRTVIRESPTESVWAGNAGYLP